jgi:4-amino-4-deoxy-L-arabinose transferase-like glycosyltransferase
VTDTEPPPPPSTPNSPTDSTRLDEPDLAAVTATEPAPLEPPATGTGSPPRRRAIPRRLWLIVALQGLLMLALTILYPPFQNADEAAHVDYVLAHRDGVWFDGPGERYYQSGVLIALGQVPNSQALIHIGNYPPVPRGDRKSFDQLGTTPARTSPPDQMVQHPPLYYGLAAGFSYLLPDFSGRGFDVQVFWLRLFSVLLLLPVPLLIFGAARRISANVNLALVAALIPLSVPSYLRIGASVTNDSLLILLTTVLLALLVRVAWGDLSRRTALWVGLAWGADVLTKGFALALPVAILACYLVDARGSLIARIKQSWRPALLGGALGSAIGAWWWVRNLIVYGAVQPNGFGPVWAKSIHEQELAGHHPPGTYAGLIQHFVTVLGPRIWGSLGLIDTPSLPRNILWLLLIVATALVLISLLRRDPTTGWGPVRALVLCLPLLLTLGVMFWGVRATYLRGQVLPGMQARYLVPDSLGIAICIAVAICWLSGRYQRWMAPLILTGSLLFVAASAARVIDIEMSPTEAGRFQRFGDGLAWIAAWAPWRASVSAMIVGATALVALVSLMAFWRSALTERTPARDQVDAPLAH